MVKKDPAMEHLLQFVIDEYEDAPREAQFAAHQFFNAMDADGDGTVDYREYMDFLISEGFEYYADRNLFKKLDSDRNRGLDFWEVMTLYYIIKSGRPFCIECDNFLWGDIFGCNLCHVGPFCSDCCSYHDDVMFQHHNNLLYNQQRGTSMRRSQTTSSAMVRYSGAGDSSSRSMVPPRTSISSQRSGNSSLRTAYRGFELALNVANLAVGIGSCSLM